MRVDRKHACPDTSAVRASGEALYCSRCEHSVLDLRHVTERQARALLAVAKAADGKVCATLFTDDEGRPSYLVEPRRRRLPIAEAALVATMASACAPTHATATTPAASAVHPETASKQPTPPATPRDAGVPSAAQCTPPSDGGTASARDRHRPRSSPGRGRRTHPPAEEYGGLLEL